MLAWFSNNGYVLWSKRKRKKKDQKKICVFFFKKTTQNPKCTKGKEKKMYESLKRSPVF